MSGYTIKEHEEYFQVFAPKRTVQETTIKDGMAVTIERSYQEVFRIGYDPSVFDAEYEGQGYWRCDIDCGAQRWRGTKRTREVRRALEKCGFDTKTINALLAKYTAEKDGEPLR